MSDTPILSVPCIITVGNARYINTPRLMPDADEHTLPLLPGKSIAWLDARWPKYAPHLEARAIPLTLLQEPDEATCKAAADSDALLMPRYQVALHANTHDALSDAAGAFDCEPWELIQDIVRAYNRELLKRAEAEGNNA